MRHHVVQQPLLYLGVTMRLQFKGMYPSLSAQERRTTKALQQVRCVISGLAFSLIVSLLAGGNALAANFNFTKVVDSNTPIPGGTGNFNTFYTPSLDNKSVAFVGRGNSNFPGGQFFQEGLYTTVGGSLNVIADRSTPIPNGTGNFQFFLDQTLDNGSVAFIGAASVGTGEVLSQQGVYTNLGGSLNVIADLNTPIPGSTRNFGFLNWLTFDNESVAFRGSSSGQFSQSGIYTNVGGSLNVIADLNTPIPNGTGNFNRFEAPTLDNGSVAFSGFRNVSLEPTQSGIYTNVGGSLNVIADLNTPIPNGTGNFTSFSEPILDNKSVAFVGYAGSFSPEGIYTNLGDSLSVIIDRNTPIPDGTGNFTNFGRLSFNKGNIAFVNTAYVSSTPGSSFQGIYTTLGGELTKVIDINDSLLGKTINSFSFGREGLSGNQIAFGVTFSDRSQAIYIATLNPTSVPESSTALGVLAIGAMFAPSIFLGKYKKSK